MSAPQVSPAARWWANVGGAAPTPARIAGSLTAAQGVGVVVFAVLVVVSGSRNRAATGQLLAQGVYYAVLGLAMGALGIMLARGARWARTPVIVVQIIVLAVGFWMAGPSGRPDWGLPLIALGVLTGGLLMLRPVTRWAERFGPPPADPVAATTPALTAGSTSAVGTGRAPAAAATRPVRRPKKRARRPGGPARRR